MWNQLKDSTHLFGRSLLYRKNILNINTFKLILKQDYTLLILIGTVIGAILFNTLKIFTLYLIVLVIRSVFKKNIKYFIYFFIRDFKVLFGLFFFFPKKKKISYVSIS